MLFLVCSVQAHARVCTRKESLQKNKVCWRGHILGDSEYDWTDTCFEMLITVLFPLLGIYYLLEFLSDD
jgi:hypothetical protein